MAPKLFLGRRILHLILVPLCLVLILVNVALQLKNSKLALRFDELLYARGPRPGGTLPRLLGEDASGNRVAFDFSGEDGPILLLALSARCGACAENWPRWRELTRRIKARAVYADVADSASRGYLREFQIPEQGFITRIDLETRWIHDLRETPQTIVLGKAGKIERVWLGVLSSADIAEIRGLLSK